MEAKVPIYIKEHFKYRATSIDKTICRNKILEFQKRKKHAFSFQNKTSGYQSIQSGYKINHILDQSNICLINYL